jgi:hypothetical protein
MNPYIDPCGTANDRAFTATWSPKVLVTFSISTMFMWARIITRLLNPAGAVYDRADTRYERIPFHEAQFPS